LEDADFRGGKNKKGRRNNSSGSSNTDDDHNNKGMWNDLEDDIKHPPKSVID
jgi:hypothetical protein